MTSQCGQSPGRVGGVEGNEIREISRGGGWSWGLLWGVRFYSKGDVRPWEDSLTESFRAGVLEVLRNEGIVFGNSAPQAGSGSYWPCMKWLEHHQVTQLHPSTSAQGSLLSGPSCPLQQVLGTTCIRILSPVQTLAPPRPTGSGF